MLAYLQNKPSADHLAVLIAYYKCALAIGYLEWAMKVRRAIDWCINLWRGEEAGVFALPEKMQGLLYNVVYRRVVANNWEEPRLPAENLPHRSFVHAQIEAYADPRQFRYINSPIVRHSPATRWLARHRKKLEEILRHADHLPPKRRAAYLESVAEELPAAPTPQTRYCLPVRADFVWDTNEGEPPYLEDGSIWGQRRHRNL
jgi:hypothetical protein